MELYTWRAVNHLGMFSRLDVFPFVVTYALIFLAMLLGFLPKPLAGLLHALVILAHIVTMLLEYWFVDVYTYIACVPATQPAMVRAGGRSPGGGNGGRRRPPPVVGSPRPTTS